MNFPEKNSLEYEMKKQETLGYPKFKKRIARELQSEYNIELKKAMSLVFSKKVSDKIDSDIDWAQHMGADFWATEIYENFISKSDYALT